MFGCLVAGLQAQGLSRQYLDYIERYKGMAVDQMLRYKIPASITLAQGLLESGRARAPWPGRPTTISASSAGGPGRGRISCRTMTRGTRSSANTAVWRSRTKTIRVSCSRRVTRRSLNCRPGTTRAGRADLKRCGYATNPRYASLLINLVERYELDQFDKHKSGKLHYDYSGIDRMLDSESLPSHLVYHNNENYYIIAREGDTFDLLAEETGVSARDIRKFNELPKGYVLQTGDVLYLERKRKKAAKKYKDVPHVVKAGESMYTIAQRYGIRLESLYDMNNLPDDYAVQVNDILRVR